MIDWIMDRLRALPPWGIGIIAVGAVGLVVGGAIAGYRTYDYVEHDNEFCLSCHLMVEPYELFARSAHRDMGCKACHKPSFAARSQMALSQIVVNPDSIRHHAEVPNEKCASCHIEGDPERWESIRNSAGHRVHLESDDPVLEGLQCVECHSSSLHQFTAASETCAQSDCHTDSDVQLGGMGNLTIHCTACHGFSDPVPEGVPLEAALAAVEPDAEACLSCHAMRTLVEMPPNEPHDAVCGSCHNPHEQLTPEDAVETCATSECHTDPEELTPMHRGLDPGELSACTQCHEAHHWEIEATDCVSCHQDIFDTDGAPAGRPADVAARPTGAASDAGTGDVGSAAGAAGPEGERRARRAGLIHPVGSPGMPPGGPSAGDAGTRLVPLAPQAGQRAQAPDTTFRHAQHRQVECTSCHSTEVSHGQITVVSITDCRSCHHQGEVASECADCHAAGSGAVGTYPVARSMSLSTGDVASRELPFEHQPHDGLACSECHTAGLTLSARSVDCTSCHEDHHTPERSCMSCHVEAPDDAHPLEVHRGCGGSGCHTEVAAALQGVPRTRPFCLTCHQDLVDHRPERACEECHSLPAPRVAGAGA